MSVDLATEYLGLNLANPLIVAACPLTAEMDVLRRIEDLGAAGAVLPSLFEEQVESPTPPPATPGSMSPTWADSLQYHRELAVYNRGPDSYLKYIGQAKQHVKIPLIASLNVRRHGRWLGLAKEVEQAGADALELNIYFLSTDSGVSAGQIEDHYVELVQAVREQTRLPLAVKLGPYFTALPHLAKRLTAAGASGLVLFNRYLQPDVGLSTLRPVPHLSLSTSEELRLALRWIAVLRAMTGASLVATGGVHSAEDVVKASLVGADAVMMASALYKHGVQHISKVLEGIKSWLRNHDYASLSQIHGMLSHKNCPDPAAFERANYTKAISSFLSKADY